MCMETFYSVKDFGAAGDGKSLDTEAIQAAIDRCSQEGGGYVLLEKGEFISGILYMKSGVYKTWNELAIGADQLLFRITIRDQRAACPVFK